MDRIISCEFNIDTACVEVKYTDGSMISIDCTRVEYEVAGICTKPVNSIGWSIMPSGLCEFAASRGYSGIFEECD